MNVFGKIAPLLFASLAASSFAAEDPAMLAAREPTVADLEKAFWYCDYVATTEGYLAAPIAACQYATDALKKEKFAGNFADLVKWWRSNKPAEHLKVRELRERREADL